MLYRRRRRLEAIRYQLLCRTSVRTKPAPEWIQWTFLYHDKFTLTLILKRQTSETIHSYSMISFCSALTWKHSRTDFPLMRAENSNTQITYPSHDAEMTKDWTITWVAESHKLAALQRRQPLAKQLMSCRNSDSLSYNSYYYITQQANDAQVRIGLH